MTEIKSRVAPVDKAMWAARAYARSSKRTDGVGGVPSGTQPNPTRA